MRALALSAAIAMLCAGMAGAQTVSMAAPEVARAGDIPPTPVSAFGLGTYEGRTVHDIQFRGVRSDERVLAHLRELVAQKANEPLDRQKIRSSILQLYATGRFADLQVQAEPRPDAQLSLVFIAEGNHFVGRLKVDGMPKRPPSTGPRSDFLPQ